MGHSFWTIYRATEVVSEFMEFLESRGKTIKDLNVKDVEAYYSWLLSFNSLNCVSVKATFLKPFIKWLSEYFEDERFKAIWEQIRIPKRSKVRLEIPNDKTVLSYLNAITNLKYRALFALLAETGLRLGEALSLSPKDFIDHEDHYEVRIMSEKTNEVRTVYVAIFYDYVKTWMEKLPKNTKYVFFGRNPEKPLSPSSFRQYLMKIEKAYKLPHIWPHLLRHYNAVRLLRLGLSEKEVREFHGWKTSKMIDRYAPYLPYLKDKYLRLVGLKKTPEIHKELKPIACLRCGHQNAPGLDFCSKCGAPLSQRAVLSMSERLSKLEKELEELKRLLS